MGLDDRLSDLPSTGKFIHRLSSSQYVGCSALTSCTAVLSEARAKLREWAVLAGKGWLPLSGSVVLASLKAAVLGVWYIAVQHKSFGDKS